ncbi:MAG TPA: hypothetical protein VMU04_01640 [Candidatus Acidoferrum sp.]|nr:hypothetical protein [Candidatus Acidoferrum sp.]
MIKYSLCVSLALSACGRLWAAAPGPVIGASPLVLSNTPCQTPTNDNWTSPTVLQSAIPQFVLANNFCATTNQGEPWIDGVRGGASIWFLWTPSTNETVTLTTLGSDFDTLLAVYYSADATNLTGQIAANNDIGPGTVQSAVAFSAEQGTNYLITVDGVNGAQGNVRLNFNSAPNDMFSNCQAIAGLTGTIYGFNIGATKEAGEPYLADDAGGASVWYCWTAPASGMEVFDTIGSYSVGTVVTNLDTLLAVYTGYALNALTLVAADDDYGGDRASRLAFRSVAGTTYHIAVDGYNFTDKPAVTGMIELNWNPPSRLTIAAGNNTAQVSITGGLGWYAIESAPDLQSVWTNCATFYMPRGGYRLTVPAGYYKAVQIAPPY